MLASIFTRVSKPQFFPSFLFTSRLIRTQMESESKPKIYFACDHGGFDYKEKILEHLTSQGYEVEDYGCHSCDSVDFPDYGYKVAKSVVEDEENRKGIVVCGTGIGVSIAANKVKGARCALCYDYFTAETARQHNNVNVLALGARTTGIEVCKQVIDVFLKTKHITDVEKYPRRLAKLAELEDAEFK
ncbi:unnamed protein product [Moneuplotes crassus]|uniref:Ribose-5-phosphate isomerase n=1 Tax=Euplotes crassus TaxID=5936 RepID=A0AAD2D6M0_EUPCR|nr:unnamed protein product [Moneuplotes crassus]